MSYKLFENIKKGDTLIISQNPVYWSSVAGGIGGRNKVQYPYTLKVENIKECEDSECNPHFGVLDTNGYGWSISDSTAKLFTIVNNRKSRINNFYK